LPNDIKKECLLELNKLDNNKDKNKNDKKSKDNNQINTGNSLNHRNNKKSHRTVENINKKKSKKEKTEKIIDKNNNIINQKAYYNEFLYGSEKESYANYLNENFVSEKNTKFLPYYKEIYGEAKQ